MNKSKTIFKYKISPTNNFLTNDSSIKSLTIKSNGILLFEQFKFYSNIKVNT